MRRLLQNRRTEPYQQERPENRHRRIHLPRRSGTDRHDPLPRLRTETGHPLLRRPANLHPRPEAGLHQPPRTAGRGFPRTRPGQSHPRMGRRTALRRKRPDETLGIHIAAAGRNGPALRNAASAAHLPLRRGVRYMDSFEGRKPHEKTGNEGIFRGCVPRHRLRFDDHQDSSHGRRRESALPLLRPERRRPHRHGRQGTRTTRRRMCRTRRIARHPGKLFDRIRRRPDKGGLLPRRGHHRDHRPLSRRP